MNYDITYHYWDEFRVNVSNLWSPAFELYSIVVLLIDIIRFTYLQKLNYSTNDSWFYLYIVKLETEASYLTDIFSKSLEFFDFLMRPYETRFLLYTINNVRIIWYNDNYCFLSIKNYKLLILSL